MLCLRYHSMLRIVLLALICSYSYCAFISRLSIYILYTYSWHWHTSWGIWTHLATTDARVSPQMWLCTIRGVFYVSVEMPCYFMRKELARQHASVVKQLSSRIHLMWYITSAQVEQSNAVYQTQYTQVERWDRRMNWCLPISAYDNISSFLFKYESLWDFAT